MKPVIEPGGDVLKDKDPLRLEARAHMGPGMLKASLPERFLEVLHHQNVMSVLVRTQCSPVTETYLGQ